MSFGSVFQSVGAVKEKERSSYDLVLTDRMHVCRRSQLSRGCVNFE